MLLLNFVERIEAATSYIFFVGDINGILFSMVFTLCNECFKFASHLTKSVFCSFHTLVVSFQISIALYCVLM